ncbi:MAG TPA: hypothetical protein VMY80_16915 [Anaerolineae bacterium]|nr:hypothetical protein [Anaerolineae bacterium]
MHGLPVIPSEHGCTHPRNLSGKRVLITGTALVVDGGGLAG